jgi:flagellar hook assembly protein FlgD
LQNPGEVRIEFFDSAGRLVDATELGPLPPGPHEYTWWGRGKDGRSLPSGNYFYSIVSGGERRSRKMLLLK